MNLNNLIQYCKAMNLKDPLSGIVLPSPLSSDLARSAIVVRCGLLTPVFGEPDVFRETVITWNATMKWTYEHLIAIYNAKYDPIENYDRYEEWNDKRENDRSGSDAHSGTDREHEEREITTSAENISTYQPDNHSEDDRETNYGHKIERKDTGKESGERKGHIHGNIGVMTAAQMIQGDIDMIDRFDVYRWIADRFEKDNMLMIY